MMAWVLDELYPHLFHKTDFVEKSFIIPLGMEASLTTLMEHIEATHSGVKVFSLPSVGDPRKGGVFAKRHIELGLKGAAVEVDKAFPFLREGVLKLGFEIHDLPQAGD
jgi:molybdopterin-biosynthesis enzyme MoeA-like protein